MSQNERLANSPELEPSKFHKIERGLSGASRLIGLDPQQHQALQAHFLPYVQIENPKQTKETLLQLAKLFNAYDKSQEPLLMGNYKETSLIAQQKRYRRQRGVMASLLGSPTNALRAVSLPDFLKTHLEYAEPIIKDVGDVLMDMLGYYILAHRLDRTKVLGKEAISATVADKGETEPEDQQRPKDQLRVLRFSDVDSFDFLLKRTEHAAEAQHATWEGRSTLSLGRPNDPGSPYTDVAAHPRLSWHQTELLMATIATGHEARTRLEHESDLPEEEREELRSQIREGIRARRIVVVHNLRLAIARVGLTPYSLMHRDDAIQQANLALIIGVDSYDPYRNIEDEFAEGPTHALSTHVNFVMRRYLSKAAAARRRANDLEDVRLLMRVQEEAQRLEGREVPYVEAARWLNFGRNVVDMLVKGEPSGPHVSLDRRPSVKHREALPDLIDDKPALEIERVENEFDTSRLWTHLKENLRDSDFKMLTMYYQHGYDQKEIAQRYGMTRQNVSLIINKAIRLLRDLVQDE